ncbi:MAG: D-alanine--D-alanine ligase, partial [Candidatus Omnitrophica bacterium]|nr:D-alanine--D-alanine ligase [Candidatus Omnitrophota bacterium]
MIIGLTYDVKEDWEIQEGDPADINAEFDKPATIQSIINAIISGGHTVKIIGNFESLIRSVDNLGVDIVFNICEGRTGRNRESQVPVLLEAKKVPYVGSDGLTLGITLDKVIAKKLFQSEGIRTPRFFEARKGDDLEALNVIGFPLIVKTRHEGSSKGITSSSRVVDLAGLKRQVELINDQYDQPALVEEFIGGTEFTVAVLGNEEPKAMEPVQISIAGKVDMGEDFYTFNRFTADHLQYICPA